MARIFCPKCGEIGEGDMAVEDVSLRRQNFRMSPICPVCLKCHSRVLIPWQSNRVKVIVLSGTCGSGKSAIAEYLMERHGYSVIDGDCAIQAVKHKYNLQKAGAEILCIEIADEIRILASLNKNIVLAHVVEPKHIGRYMELFEALGLEYRIFYLQPALEAALERVRHRTCHASVTPEKWVRYFYDALLIKDEDIKSKVTIYDNTRESVCESAERIMELSNRGGSGS